MSLGQIFAQRVRWHRTRQGKSQAVVAGLAGLNAEYLGQIERGYRIPSLDVVEAIAGALGVSVPELVAESSERPSPAPDVLLASELHRALLLQQEASSGRSTDELQEAVEHAWRLWQGAADRYSRLAAVVPDLIGDVATINAPGATDPLLEHRVATDAYALLRTVARRIGRPDLALVAADRERRAAEQTEDDVRLARANWNLAHALLGQQEPQTAEEIALAAIADIKGHGTREAAAISGALWLAAAVAAARSQRRFAAIERIRDHARPLAEKTGETNVGRTAFGPTNVALHMVSVELEDGHTADALAIADEIDPAPLQSRERRTTLALDLARSHAMRSEPGAALLHLLEAEQSSAEELRYNPTAHDTVRRVFQRARPSLRKQLTAFAQRVGIEDELAAGHTLS
ncbi:helix-turn-helix domain-containing protein [Streptomonospora litoralis]|uniref:Anaerobic benzoate catabolism transcriptional regulator n=1 Tax=Streptomonospora litoralis TaxID=2498135 RepID=A0A4P6Q5U5_9ACTN|nr:helix-turn-helix transcriptional regulator [Streptomonospora litoralis]QBI56118.1 anaerobic benzoate catabolism transcriptional regulator [Streptomonospora litoralis]